MRSKGNMALATVIVISVVLTVVAGVMLYMEKASLSKTRQTVDTQFIRLNNSAAIVPFPSSNNIAAVARNVKTQEDDLAILRKDMNRGQVQVVDDMRPLEWLTLLGRIRKSLQDSAKTNKVALPPNFYFGFQKYADGRPPASATHVRRLTVQVRTVERISRILYASGIKGMVSVTRDQFEETAPSISADTKASPLAAAAGTNEVPLFTREHYRVEFSAKEASIIAALNNLAADAMFIAPTGVRIATTSSFDIHLGARAGAEVDRGSVDGAPEGTAATAKAAGPDLRPRDERVVAGRGNEIPAQVVLDLEVYDFSQTQEEPGK